MSLLDEWEGAVPSYGEALGPSEGLSADPGIEEGAEAFSPRRSLDSALFSLETVERHIARWARLLSFCDPPKGVAGLLS